MEVTKTVTDESPKTVTATKENDVVFLEDAGHVVYLLGGDDFVCGSVGADVVYGGDGDDRLYGKVGPDSLFGEAGHDKLKGEEGRDKLAVGDDDGVPRTGGDEGDVKEHEEVVQALQPTRRSPDGAMGAGRIPSYGFPAPVAQGIEHRFPNSILVVRRRPTRCVPQVLQRVAVHPRPPPTKERRPLGCQFGYQRWTRKSPGLIGHASIVRIAGIPESLLSATPTAAIP